MSDPKAQLLSGLKSIRNGCARARLGISEAEAMRLIGLVETCDVTPAAFIPCPNCAGSGKARNPAAPGARPE